MADKITKKADLKSAGPEAEMAGASSVPVRQDAPTAPRSRDKRGFEIDENGLPVNIHARSAVLTALNMTDPQAEPQKWEDAAVTAGEIAKVMEKIYG